MDSENRLDKFFSENKLPLAMGVVGLVLLVGGIISSGIIPKTFVKTPQSLPAVQASVVSQGNYKVDVSGAVNSPGVYTLSTSARIEDALKMAGGITASADPNYMSKTINLAQKVSDGMKIYVPVANEAGQSASPSVAGVAKSVLVNVNEASLSELDQLPGVGPVTAQSILDKRPYSGIEELLAKKSVTRATYDKIKTMVAVY